MRSLFSQKAKVILRMRCILGIDSGGTKCHAMLIRDDGALLGFGRVESGASSESIVFEGRGRSREVMAQAVAQAVGDIRCEELHIGCLTSRLPVDFLKTWPLARIKIHQVSEAGAAFALAGETSGIVALAGTGALVFGQTRDNRKLALDGLGPFLGDYGSGYQIGHAVICAAAQSAWHPRHITTLTEAVYKACGGKKGDVQGWSLVPYTRNPHDRSEIASFARLAIDAAADGDVVARDILKKAAEDLAETVRDMVKMLAMDAESYPLIGTGGIIVHSDLYWNHFCAEVREFAPAFKPFRSDLPPVAGLLMSVLQAVDGIDQAAAKTTLIESVRNYLKTPGTMYGKYSDKIP
jgi:N-acetylglucosamine kinase-like BadF-type ATPase